MVDIFLIRHSSTTANENKKGATMCGSTNAHLSERGKELARDTRNNTDWSNSKGSLNSISAIYCSMLDRTYETVECMFPDIIYKYSDIDTEVLTQGKIPVYREKCFDEIDFGDFEMTLKNDMPDDILNLWNNEPELLTFPNGDNMELRTAEAYNRFLEIVEKSNGPIIVVSSCTTLRCLLTRIQNLPLKDFHKIQMKNCEVYHLKYNRKKKQFHII